MPFVLGDDDLHEHPRKKRKISHYKDKTTTMAKHKDDDFADEHWSRDQERKVGSEEKQKSKTTQYPSQVVRTSSREELIECIKRGQRPEWVPQSGFQALRDQEEALVAQRKLKVEDAQTPEQPEPSTSRALNNDAHEVLDVKHESKGEDDLIERPRSALHRGDFAEDDSRQFADSWPDLTQVPGLALSTSGLNASPPSWLSASPRPTSFEAASHVRALNQINTAATSRRRAPSLGSSLSSSFVLRTPTSPLVQATSHLDFDTRQRPEASNIDHAFNTNSRRRTMPPNSFQAFSMTPIDTATPNFSRPFAPALRREASLPTQGHLSRRSLTSVTYQPRSGPQTPLFQSRRSSLASESRSRRRTSMVGSFEESILRGRMSTPPSKPLDFVAQIGVMGKGDCPSNLKCPAHVSVPFPAVFYSYPASTQRRSISDDTPSPYVGTVNLGEHLKPVTLASNKSRKAATSQNAKDHQSHGAFQDLEHASDDGKLFVGGAYRVPQQGQLQIIIKNPNKTAVKLFLIPYDLTGMEAGHKTFVRQRSYSTGPIIENALGDQRSVDDPLENKNILRYLIHLKFCCPANNRFYLYDDIRVVFANRVPDGKEKLRNEAQTPEPRFSIWKSTRPNIKQAQSGSTPGSPIVNTFEMDSSSFFGDMDDFLTHARDSSPSPSERGPSRVRSSPPKFTFPVIAKRDHSTELSKKNDTSIRVGRNILYEHIGDTPQTPTRVSKAYSTLSPVTGFAPTTPLRNSPIPWRSPPSASGSSRSFSPLPAEPGDGLLSKQFRELQEKQSQSRSHSPLDEK